MSETLPAGTPFRLKWPSASLDSSRLDHSRASLLASTTKRGWAGLRPSTRPLKVPKAAALSSAVPGAATSRETASPRAPRPPEGAQAIGALRQAAQHERSRLVRLCPRRGAYPALA